MNILIVDKQTNMVVSTVPVNIAKNVGRNHIPTEEEYFEEAWKCAVQDGDVVQNTKKQYSFIQRFEE